MSFRKASLVAFALLSSISAANAGIFYAYDPASTSAATATNSAAAFGSFSAVGGVGTETFDSYAYVPPGAFVATGNGITFTSNWSDTTSPFPAPVMPAVDTTFYSNVLGGNYPGFADSFHFNSPIFAFAANIINIGDSGASTTLSITVDFNGTNVRTYDFSSLQTFSGGGFNSTGFVGLTLGAEFNNVTINRGGSGGDVLGFNSISVSAVPEPGTWALMGSAIGAAGLLGLRRRRQSA